MYVDDVSFEKRAQEAQRMLDKYPSKAPLIIEPSPKSRMTGSDKRKFMVPRQLSMSHLLATVRSRIDLESSHAIFILINNTLPKMTDTIGEVYDAHKAEDGLLYVVYAKESTFG